MQEPSREQHRGTWAEVLISAVLGLVAAFVLAREALTLAENPLAELSCNVSSTVSCAVVGRSWQAEVFGFPNAFIGLMTEPVLISLAVASLAGVRFPRWYMWIAQGVAGAGFVFALWLFAQSYWIIGALCPWCLLVTVTTTLIFFGLLKINLLSGAFGPSAQRRARLLVHSYRVDLLAPGALLTTIACLILLRYA